MNSSNQQFSVRNDTVLDINSINIVLNFKYVSSSLSILGIIFIIFSYFYLCFQVRFKKTRQSFGHSKSNQLEEEKYKDLKMGYGNDLIFCLSISELISSIVSFIKSDSIITNVIDSTCIIQGVFSNIFEISSVCWTTAISVSILLATTSTEIGNLPKYYFCFFIYSYALPLILSIGPLMTNSYGPAGAWCWMNVRNNSDNVAMIWAFSIYFFHWLNIIFNFIVIIKTIRYFKIRAFEVQEKNEKEANFLRNYCIVLKFFPIILIICWIPATTNRLYNLITDYENTTLYSIHAFFSSLQGFLNAIVYSFYYRNLFRVCFKIKEVKEENKMAEEEAKEDIEIQIIK